MYAIIQTGGKQYRVAEGDVVQVELLGQEAGHSITFDHVLFVSKGEKGPHVGPGFLVTGEIVGQASGPKIVSCKYKRRQTQRKKFGHRQKYSKVKITGITAEKKHHGA